LWWGHRIPAWFGDDGQCYVAEDEAGAQALAGQGVTLKQDEDVLDTWFSSALWPIGTLGWPESNPKLAKHYPNDVLISGFDILFFWDARMAMQGLHFMKEVPWKTLYLHGLVRAPDGSKMSKSKGNTVDPLGLIDQYGADALRFTLAAMESQGRDIKLDEKRVEGYRNFATKLWNAARFLQGNGVGASASIKAPEATLAVNKWIIGEVVETLAKLDQAIADLRYDAMADAIYHFAFDSFCDWYIELVKGAFDDETRTTAGWVFDQILVMTHPFMPFITEELWHGLGKRECDIIHARWPEPAVGISAEAAAEIGWVVETISKVRSAKAELGIAPGTRMTANITAPSTATSTIIANQMHALQRLGRIDQFVFEPPVTSNLIQLVVNQDTLALPLDGLVDLDAERARLTKSAEAAEKEAASLSSRLNNPAFVEKAKPEAVEKARADHAEKSAEAERLRAALARLG
jgi:valyl-tRNA synthetase